MSDTIPTFAGWYPDPNTGGTKYWDGSRWTGDVRPRRRSFAAAAGERESGILLAALAVMFPVMGVMALFDERSDEPVSTFLITLVIGFAGAVGAVYVLRGQGPTTKAIEARLAAERKEANSKRRTANLAGAAAAFGRFGRPLAPTPSSGNDAAAAAQISALTDPGTAKALQNLQNLLYTRTITEAEYAAAKDKLFGSAKHEDQFSQIEKLAELYHAGILGDVEFAAAKARALGL